MKEEEGGEERRGEACANSTYLELRRRLAEHDAAADHESIQRLRQGHYRWGQTHSAAVSGAVTNVAARHCGDSGREEHTRKRRRDAEREHINSMRNAREIENNIEMTIKVEGETKLEGGIESSRIQRSKYSPK